ncbi:MAG TPA: DUF433 domain-containing protein [Gemmataceae bacterium]|jgi:uncharacterized protein (DUF433 family)|nr:DUF433 domain-containing protein [Gemmataceae bacterium]HZY89880.1 DUF433 domain-containing protein [Gemmataceae bacterium]
MTLPDFLRADEYGEVFLAGHRVTLYHVIKDYREGYSAEMLASAYPTLPLALAHKVIAFYLENQAEVEQYVEETRAEIERQAAAPPRGPSLADLKRRMEAKRHA